MIYGFQRWCKAHRAQGRRGLAVVLVGGLLAAFGCGDRNLVQPVEVSPSTSEQAHGFGDDVPVDIAIYFVESVDDRGISDFQDLLHKPEEPGRPGQDLLDGIKYMGGDFERRAVYVTFTSDATDVQRDAVREIADSSPIVARVLTNVRPLDVPVS